jgi:hypothetical protein
MPLDDSNLPDNSSGPQPLALTGVPTIDELLMRMGDAAVSQEVAAYVYANMKPRPDKKAKVKRAVYVAFGDTQYSDKGVSTKPYEFTYTLSDDDIATLARALRGECGPYSAEIAKKAEVEAWMFFNRFMLNPNHFGTTSFAKCLMYATATLSPLWYRDGAKCKLGGPYHGKEECSEELQTKRDKTRNGPLVPQYQKIAEKMAVGTLPQPPKAYIDVGNIKLNGIEKYGDNIDGIGDYFLTTEKYFEWKPKAQIRFVAGRVAMMGTKQVYPDDPRGPMDPKGKLFDYVVANIVGTDRATKNANTDKRAIYAAASSNFQSGATATLQQTANVVQSTIAMKDLKVSSFKDIQTSSDGFQAGSDDTWCKV